MNIHHHTPRRLMALVLALVLCIGMVPSAFAAQEDNYHDPAEHWMEALNRTNELDANSVVTIETFNCCECGQATSFEVFRVPEYPYVWGGSSPATSFDCSGFVSWAINHCGVGWDFGRRGSDSLYFDVCTPISASEARPGDLVFFQGTYDTPYTSHVGIYVGDGMMLHCGDPIQYTSIETSYWQSHFYGFGRLPAP